MLKSSYEYLLRKDKRALPDMNVNIRSTTIPVGCAQSKTRMYFESFLHKENPGSQLVGTFRVESETDSSTSDIAKVMSSGLF